MFSKNFKFSHTPFIVTFIFRQKNTAPNIGSRLQKDLTKKIKAV